MYRQLQVQETYKVLFNDRYLIQILFKSQLCQSFIVVDKYSSRKYQNQNVKLQKINKAIMIAALEKKKPKEIKCIILQRKQKNQDNSKNMNQNILQFQFSVDTSFINPFSQSLILYQFQSKHKNNQIIPQNLSAQNISQIKSTLIKISESLPSLRQNQQQQDIKIFEISSINLMKSNNEQFYQNCSIIVSNIFLFIVFIQYLTWIQYLQCLVIQLIFWWQYFCYQKFQIYKSNLKKGYYKVEVTGTFLVQNYNQNLTEGFIIHATFGKRNHQKLKVYIRNMYAYGYPFVASFLIQTQKEEEQLCIQVQKNLKIYSVNLTNIVISVQRMNKINF